MAGKIFAAQTDGLQNVILIDDVFTTGATANACARVLKQSGAQKVVVISVARG
jgi:predicted amidophosphoribosyltransferase